MKDNSRDTLFARHPILTQLLGGAVLLAVVFFAAARFDIAAAQRMMASTTGYVKEQCNRYARIELASETKSLMRVIESSKQAAHRLAESGGASREELKRCAEESYVSGILLLDPAGRVVDQYHAEGAAPAPLAEYLDSSALLDVAAFPEKRYAVRFHCPDGSEVDLAATRRQDGEGTIVVYYHTPVEYINSFNLSVSSLLSGYDLENDGTIVVSSGSSIVASNDPALIGSSTDDIAILRKIRAASDGDKLLHANQQKDVFAQYFGLMERGRDFYVYSYLPEKSVFDITPRVMFYALIVYLAVLAAISTVRWRTAQRYREKQMAAQREYAENLQNKNEQLSIAVDQADRANAAKTSFLSRMSHDIRTPLNGIIGLLEIDAAHPEDMRLIRANREKMQVAADHLLSLINDILQMSKLESGEILLAHEPMDLNRLFREIMTIIEQRAAESGITMEYDRRSDPVEVSSVYGSPLHLRQIFLNIYTNCIKYNRVGGRVTTTLKCLGAAEGTVTYRWTITDTGIGMSEAYLKRIFDPFSQERSDARSVYQGSGLGMAIVKGLIDKMNGTIAITSREGVGSTFAITLPFEIAEKNAAAGEGAPAAGAQTDSIQGVRLLLAEDNALNVEIAEVLLGDEGAQISVVNDGQQAVERFRTSPPGTFDAILMDVMMPVMDGLSAARAIRALNRPDAGTIPIIAMTANAFEEDAQKCLAAGMNAHLAKPLRVAALKKTICEQLALRAGGKPLRTELKFDTNLTS